MTIAAASEAGYHRGDTFASCKRLMQMARQLLEA
jgi:hypothetical protein